MDGKGEKNPRKRQGFTRGIVLAVFSLEKALMHAIFSYEKMSMLEKSYICATVKRKTKTIVDEVR